MSIIQKEMDEWNINADFYREDEHFPFHDIFFNDLKTIYDLLPLSLEIGCGSEPILADSIAIDFSIDMLKNIDNRKVCCSISHLPFKSDIFNSCVAIFVFHHLKAQGIGYDEVYRVLKKDGILQFTDRNDSIVDLFLFRTYKIMRKIFNLKSGCASDEEVVFLRSDYPQNFILIEERYSRNFLFNILIVISNILRQVNCSKLSMKIQKRFKKVILRIETKRSSFLSTARTVRMRKK